MTKQVLIYFVISGHPINTILERNNMTNEQWVEHFKYSIRTEKWIRIKGTTGGEVTEIETSKIGLIQVRDA